MLDIKEQKTKKKLKELIKKRINYLIKNSRYNCLYCKSVRLVVLQIHKNRLSHINKNVKKIILI